MDTNYFQPMNINHIINHIILFKTLQSSLIDACMWQCLLLYVHSTQVTMFTTVRTQYTSDNVTMFTTQYTSDNVYYTVHKW